MNEDQVLSLVRAVLMFMGNMLVAQGVLTAGSSTALQTGLVTLTGAIMTIAPVVWGVFVHSHTSQVAAVTAAVANGAISKAEVVNKIEAIPVAPPITK